MIRLLGKIINAGITEDCDFSERVRLRGMNSGALIGKALVILSICFGYGSAPFIWYLAVLIIVLTLSIVFNLLHLTEFSRYFTFTTLFAWLVMASMAFAGKLGLENYLYVALVGLIILEKKDSSRFIGATICAAALIFVKLYQKDHSEWYPLPALHNVFYISDIFFPCAIIAVLCWITIQDVRHHEAELMKSREMLKESNELKDKLFSIISHDLRSPMNNLNSTLILLEDGILDAEEQQYIVGQVREQLTQSANIMNSLLEWSSQNYFYSKANFDNKKGPVDMHEVSAEIFAFFRDTAAHKNVQLLNSIPSGTMVVADHDHVLFVMRNLVGNAIKFSRDDGSGYVNAEAMLHDDSVHISITDNGVGMERTQLASLFNPDKRLSTEGTRQEKGTGLGLIFCKEFIQSNGGQLYVKSECGKGSTFTFTLRSVVPERL